MTNDPRVERYRKALELALGEAVQDVSGSGDDLDRLGRAIELYISRTTSRDNESRLLQSIATRVGSGLTLEDMLDYIYESFQEIIPYQRIGLALLEENGQIVRAHWARSDQPLLLKGGFAAPMKDSSLQTILETNRPRILNDLPTYLRQKPDSNSTRLIVEEGFASSLTCPLIAAGNPLGFIFFTSRNTAVYANRHVEIFVQIANQISILLDRGRLVSELAHREQDLEVMNRELEQRNESRRAILGIAAHDLRGPLSYIRTSTALILSEMGQSMPEETPDLIANISRQARHLLDLLDKLLDFSMIEAGEMSLSWEDVEVKSWITEIVASLDARAQEKNIRIEVMPVPAGSLRCDPLRLGQVLTNFLTNALKYSPHGSKVQVKTTRDRLNWRIEVGDQGPGIRPEEIDRLFQPFRRGTAKPTGNEKSSGLGLSIAKMIVLAHKGEIGIAPDTQSGSTFWFTIPV